MIICGDGPSHVRRGRRDPKWIPTKPPARRGKVTPILIKIGRRDRWGNYTEKD